MSSPLQQRPTYHSRETVPLKPGGLMCRSAAFGVKWKKIALRAFLLLFVWGALGGYSPAVNAQQHASLKPNVVRLTVVERLNHADQETRHKAMQKLLDMVVQRVQMRLRAAEVKHFWVRKGPKNAILVEVDGSYAPAWIESLLIPAGDFAIRTVQWRGSEWMGLASQMPPGLEIRQKAGSLDESHAYVWAQKYSTLKRWVETVALAGSEVLVVPEGKGWRTLVVGDPWLTEDDVHRVSLEQSPTGLPFVRIDFRRALDQKAATSAHREVALILDGEVLKRFRPLQLEQRRSIEIGCPAETLSRPAQQLCVAQIAGRLAAPLPIQMVPHRILGQRSQP